MLLDSPEDLAVVTDLRGYLRGLKTAGYSTARIARSPRAVVTPVMTLSGRKVVWWPQALLAQQKAAWDRLTVERLIFMPFPLDNVADEGDGDSAIDAGPTVAVALRFVEAFMVKATYEESPWRKYLVPALVIGGVAAGIYFYRTYGDRL